jgi:hypothetical protein
MGWLTHLRDIPTAGFRMRPLRAQVTDIASKTPALLSGEIFPVARETFRIVRELSEGALRKLTAEEAREVTRPHGEQARKLIERGSN